MSLISSSQRSPLRFAPSIDRLHYKSLFLLLLVLVSCFIRKWEWKWEKSLGGNGIVQLIGRRNRLSVKNLSDDLILLGTWVTRVRRRFRSFEQLIDIRLKSNGWIRRGTKIRRNIDDRLPMIRMDGIVRRLSVGRFERLKIIRRGETTLRSNSGRKRFSIGEVERRRFGTNFVGVRWMEIRSLVRDFDLDCKKRISPKEHRRSIDLLRKPTRWTIRRNDRRRFVRTDRLWTRRRGEREREEERTHFSIGFDENGRVLRSDEPFSLFFPNEDVRRLAEQILPNARIDLKRHRRRTFPLFDDDERTDGDDLASAKNRVERKTKSTKNFGEIILLQKMIGQIVIVGLGQVDQTKEFAVFGIDLVDANVQQRISIRWFSWEKISFGKRFEWTGKIRRRQLIDVFVV